MWRREAQRDRDCGQASAERLLVLLAQPRGFCAGVRRAIATVEQAIERSGRPVYVRHEIVHNRHVVDGLRAKGATFVEELGEVPDGAVTVFSAHGVPRAVESDARVRGLSVVDATCPLVSKVHSQARRYAQEGRTLVLIGHRDHPEVAGTLGQVDAEMHLVGSIADVALLDLPPTTLIAYVTQTTLSVDDTRLVIAALEARFPDVRGPETNDICYATQNRQQAVRGLCRVVDVLLTVGAKNSSNSNRLQEIGVEAGVPSYLLDDASELDPEWVRDARVVGLTAGASAPEELVQGVVERLSEIRPVAVETVAGELETAEFRLPPELDLLPAAGRAG